MCKQALLSVGSALAAASMGRLRTANAAAPVCVSLIRVCFDCYALMHGVADLL